MFYFNVFLHELTVASITTNYNQYMQKSTNTIKTQISIETYYRDLISKINDQIGFMIESQVYNETANIVKDPANINKSFNELLHSHYLDVTERWETRFDQLNRVFKGYNGPGGPGLMNVFKILEDYCSQIIKIQTLYNIHKKD